VPILADSQLHNIEHKIGGCCSTVDCESQKLRNTARQTGGLPYSPYRGWHCTRTPLDIMYEPRLFVDNASGVKPLLVRRSPDGQFWVLASKTRAVDESGTHRRFRFVEKTEVGSFAHLMDQYRDCLVTDASVPMSESSKPVVCDSVTPLLYALSYLGLQGEVHKDGCMEVQSKEDQRNLWLRHPPTLRLRGKTEKGYALYEFLPSESECCSSIASTVNSSSVGAQDSNEKPKRRLASSVAAGILSGRSALMARAKKRHCRTVFSEDPKWIIL
jgi:hypothetical protein